ncbi:protein-arginine deiminase family protein [Thalassospira sp.]|uniref:protein-arginine deiminase family protein n=1 Tax=Thalassospira sp. TaxID=1912094 RepID=UPI00273755FB|nr:protein-arginine deiminase family protein [Thalassospira sp.]MDP2698462.1 protein-arginine deiminase family protein [Thalassospira sp.]
MPDYTVTLTAPAGNYPFNQVRVVLTNGVAPQETTLIFGPGNLTRTHIFPVANGNWDLKVTGAGFVPIDQAAININADATNAQDLDVIWYTLHTDRNRDGNLDDAGALNQVTPAAITYGVAGVGAIIPVNCNRDGNNTAVGYADNQDQRVNGNNDLVSGTARLEIRRNALGPNAAAPAVPAGWDLQLQVFRTVGDNPARQHIRILDGVLNNSAEIIGPETTDSAAVTTGTVGASKLFAIEAVRFAGNGFANGDARIELDVIQPEITGPATRTYWYSDRIVAARWVGNHHLQESSDLFVAQTAGNLNFRNALGVSAAASNPGINITTGNPATANRVNIRYLHNNAWANDGTVVPGDDRWMRDTIVSGYSSWPGNGGGIQTKNVFVKTHRWRPLQNWVFETLHSAGNGITYPAAGSADDVTSANSGGNISLTPPVKTPALAAVARNYPLGRVYYGHNFYHRVDQSTRNFLASQVMQRPIILDTDWLEVGHVDEMMTFIPDLNPADPYKKWKLVVASPAEAYQIMTANQGAHGAARILNRTEWNVVTNSFDYASLQIDATDVGATLNDFLGNGQAPLDNPRTGGPYTYQQLRDWNINGVEAVITRNVNILKNAFDLLDTDIIKAPVIFIPGRNLVGNALFASKIDAGAGFDNGFNVFPGKRGGFQCGALTGDMPNMFVGNERLMIPKPFGPWIEDNTDAVHHGYDLFERDLFQKIAAIHHGPVCDFIDDWDDYHVALGEIHCGTNEIRTPYDGATAFGNIRYANWWTAVDA